MQSSENLEDHAREVVLRIDSLVHDAVTVEAILAPYQEFCRGDEARRLQISETPVTHEMLLRLRFECVCFSTFCASLLSSKYVVEKRWLVKRPNEKLIQFFDGALAVALIDLCRVSGMTELRDIVLLGIDPDIRFGPGKPLDPLDRLEEYRSVFVKARGKEASHFGKWIGKALDAPHYLLLQVIGGRFAAPLMQLADAAMAGIFGRG